MVTPGQPRAVRVVTRSRANSNASHDGDGSHLVNSVSRPASRNDAGAVPGSNDRRPPLSRSGSQQQLPETVSRYGSSTIARSRNGSAEAAPPGSHRVKRAQIGTGTFLKSGPIRRAPRRRDSEEHVSANEDAPNAGSSQPSASSYTPGSSQPEGGRSRSGSGNTRATSVEPEPVSVHDFARQNAAAYSRPPSRQAESHLSRSQVGYDSRPASRQTSREHLRTRQPSVEQYQSRRQNSVQPEDVHVEQRQRQASVEPSYSRPVHEQKPPPRVQNMGRAAYRYVPSNRAGPQEDQENLPPPTFKRNRDQDFKYLGKTSMNVLSDDEKPKPRMVDETPVPVPQQEQRKVLGAISGNTPHRPAPAAPPKMSVLDAATTTAGAGTTKSRKKRMHMVVNGKIFTQMGKIGKGGSSDVYQVMAENYKTFALKRVKLDDCDESAVRGYKGEIDLLKSLAEVDRVVRLFDFELNNDKQELLVLMEKGESDLNRLLTLRLNGVEAKFDSAFTRFYWKEMLECVQAVHEHDIVHSDLKPANFLLVQGRLKLIDFGIANAIDTDNTCNVHRDSHVGTPNYMSPESITDTNAGSGKDEAGRPLKKDMRIGKSSDVWSLGCILYQMTYGRPPFAHIPNPIPRIMAICNPKIEIEYPEFGVGGVKVAASLKLTLRRCLNRNPEKRATIESLLSDSDPYMNPEGSADQILMTEDLLGQILNKVLDRCRDPKRGIPPPEEAQQYPKSFFDRIRAMQEGL